MLIGLPDILEPKRYRVVPVRNILYVESKQDRNCKIVTLSNNSLNEFFETVLSESIGKVEEKLANIDYFQRVHYQYLVNLMFIEQYHKTDRLISIVDGKVIPVSRDKKQMLQKLLFL